MGPEDDVESRKRTPGRKRYFRGSISIALQQEDFDWLYMSQLPVNVMELA